jgi:hypothetical protein
MLEYVYLWIHREKNQMANLGEYVASGNGSVLSSDVRMCKAMGIWRRLLPVLFHG